MQSGNLYSKVGILFLQCSGPDLLRLCPCPLPRRSLSHPPSSPLHFGQITEPEITADYPAHRITDPAAGGRTHRAGRGPPASAEHMPFSENLEGLAAITHLANATGKGIYFLWATLDRIISLYSAQQQALHIVKGQPF